MCAVEQLANWMVNFAVALTAPLFLRSSPSGPYFLYGFATLFTVSVCYLFMPETKGRSLEEVEKLFEKDGQSDCSVTPGIEKDVSASESFSVQEHV